MIIIPFATIMDGQVIRWYASERAYENGGEEVMSASRNGVRVPDATDRYELLQYAIWVAKELRAGKDMRSIATHRVIGFMGREIEPVEPATAST